MKNLPGDWNPANAIREPKVREADRNEAIKALRVEKHGEAMYVFVKLTWRKDELFMTTTRDSKKPREFKNFTRLIQHIETAYPSVKCFSVNIVAPSTSE